MCTTWLIHDKHAYLRHVFRDRLEYPELKRQALALHREHGARATLIEKAGLGLSLYQDVRKHPGIGTVLGRKPVGDKIVRLEAQTALIEGGYVHLPREAPWLATFLNELLGFPNAKYDDQVDSVSQFLDYFRGKRSASGGGNLGFAPKIIGLAPY